ncbi:mannose-6-phosphate isomerase [Dichomitus squalens]|uniref:Mannose-6-phosphate isomerase n=1 Tax=Dichomitus squalens TaxID=114155 RepID=A0A4Q9MYR7_9APHY|nr:mannose-6-phosphate isomerase [Dichomitus squalens]
MPGHKSLIRLQAAKQEYDWGRQGSSSLAARLGVCAFGHGFQPDEKKCYAEIWMGTHPNGPANIFDTPSISLLDLIRSNPKYYLGEKLLTKWPATIHVPYLFKVLSIRKALPLQAHPDKSLAEQLQQRDPNNFVDANHKPEIAVAIGEPLCQTRAKHGEEAKTKLGGPKVEDADTAFTGFVGFRPLEEIKTYLEHVRELTSAIGDPDVITRFTQNPSKQTLKHVYGKLLKRGIEARNEVAAVIEKLADRINQQAAYDLGFPDSETLARLVVKVNAQYPGDVGVLATTFFMNLVKLRKGEGIYIGADEVHAYLEGDIIECMATSDNVVNAAFDSPESLAPQVDTFIDMLSYTARQASHWALPAQGYQHSRRHRTVKYDPPLEEFTVLGTILSAANAKEETLDAVEGPTIGIVTRGRLKVSSKPNTGGAQDSLELDEGCVVFVPPGHEIQVEVSGGCGPEGAGEMWWSLWDA